MLRSSSRAATVSSFTVSQWQELEHQALIFKYLMAGLAIPPDLVVPIQKSFEALSSGFFAHPSLGCCSFYGKKIDPEPGRCRRTDGKKWRCSKEAYGDSKYCERHMHRGRNRSRKHVELPQNFSQPASSNRDAANTTVFPSLPLQAFGANVHSSELNFGYNRANFNEDGIPYDFPSKDFRYDHGFKLESGEDNFFSNSSGNKNHPAWSTILTSQVSEFPVTDSAKQGSDNSNGSSLRPFFDEWPKTRDLWSGLDEERSNQGQ